MSYNLRSIGLSLMQNSDVDERYKGKESVRGRSASSLNNPSYNKQQHTPSSHQHVKTQHRQTDNHQLSVLATRQTRSSRRKTMNSVSNQQQDSNNNDKISLDISKMSLDISNNSSSSPEVASSSSKSSNTSADDPSTRVKSPSNTHISPSSSTVRDDVEIISGNDNDTFTCSVINCSAYFSTIGALKTHNNNFKHSPCNPVLLNKNCVLPKRALCYMCPACDHEFSVKEECKKHMVEKNHLSFYPPLTVTAYMCAQCLNLFGSFEDCWTHIEKMSHQAVTYAFSDDQTSPNSGPVAVIHELVDSFIKKCGKVKYSIECLECALVVDSSRQLNEHFEETNDQHSVASFTESTVGDIFASYLATYTCNVCHRMFAGELKELAKHQCSKTIVGTVVDSDITSFSEFVKRCALTLIKSLDSDNNVSPGPSRKKKKSRSDDTTGDNNGNLQDIATKKNKNDVKSTIESNLEKPKNATKKKSSSATSTQSYTEGASGFTDEDNGHLGVTVTKSGSTSSSGSKDKTKRIKKAMVISLDDSDTSDDTELCLNGSSKRKRKQYISDRTKQQVLDTSDCMVTMTEPAAGIVIHDESDDEVGGAVGGAPRDTTRRKVKSNPNRRKVAIKKDKKGNVSIIDIESDESDDDIFAEPETSRPQTSRPQTSKPQISRPQTSKPPTTKPQTTKPDSTVANNDIPRVGTSTDTEPSSSSQSTQSRPNVAAIPPLLPNYRMIPPPCAMPMSSPFSAFNFVPRSPGLPPNILTRGFVHQQHHGVNHRSAMSNLASMPQSHSATFPNVVPVCPPRYPLRNHLPQNILRPKKVDFVNQGSQSSKSTNSGTYTNNSKSPDLITTDNLKRMTNIIFLDLDNWPGFFTKLPKSLPDLTFIWGFFGGRNTWYEPRGCHVFRTMKQNGYFYLNDQCGATKDAADFAIVLAVGKMDERLPANVAFTILSGDKGFIEVERQMKESTRKVLVVNPHTAAQFSNDMIYALLTSITDT